MSSNRNSQATQLIKNAQHCDVSGTTKGIRCAQNAMANRGHRHHLTSVQICQCVRNELLWPHNAIIVPGISLAHLLALRDNSINCNSMLLIRPQGIWMPNQMHLTKLNAADVALDWLAPQSRQRFACSINFAWVESREIVKRDQDRQDPPKTIFPGKLKTFLS